MDYKAVFHVDQKDAQVFNLALNNVINLLKAIPGQEHDLIVLLNGPAVSLVTREEAAFFQEMIQGLSAQGVRFQVCENALHRFEVSRDNLIGECQVIPAGIVGLIDLQNQGFAYIKP
jgi:intracellular sulfur oxidation DsrE/DsrF family protein